jgi:hypothetical protein
MQAALCAALCAASLQSVCRMAVALCDSDGTGVLWMHGRCYFQQGYPSAVAAAPPATDPGLEHCNCGGQVRAACPTQANLHHGQRSACMQLSCIDASTAPCVLVQLHEGPTRAEHLADRRAAARRAWHACGTPSAMNAES